MKKLVRFFLLLFFLACFVLALIFAGDNSQAIPLRFLSTDLVTLPFALWLILGFASGTLVALLLLLPQISVHKSQIRRLRKKIKGIPLEEESRHG